jgi:hypothetical protein
VTFQVLVANTFLQFKMITTITLALMMMIIQINSRRMLEMIADIATLKNTWMILIKKRKKASK